MGVVSDLIDGMVRRCLENASDTKRLASSLLRVKLEVAAARSSTVEYHRVANHQATRSRQLGARKEARVLEASTRL